MSKKTKIWLGIIAISFSSAIIGGVATALVIRHKVVQLVEQGPKGVRFLAMRFLGKRLKLSNEQISHVRPAIRRAQQKLFELRSSHRAEIEAIMNQAIDEINPHLDQSQQAELGIVKNKLLKRFSNKIN